MKRTMIFAAAAFATGFAIAGVTVRDVKVSQNWPWSGLVNIDYTLDAPANALVDVTIALKNGKQPIDLGWGALDATKLYSQTAGTYRVVWDPSKTVGDPARIWSEFTAEVKTNDGDTFMVIDLATDAITFTDTPPEGGWNQDEYKTSKIVMRRIPAGTYVMGSPEDEIGHDERTERQHPVTFTNFFYLGVFEMTERQYCILEGIEGGTTAAVANNDKARVVKEGIDPLSLRGATSKDKNVFPAIESDSFFGRMNARFTLPQKLANYVFDLPTISQWEYACRAGTTGAWNNGTTRTANETTDPNLDLLGWYRKTTNFQTREVGGLLPNAFGLYDMHGNAGELCIDVVPAGTIVWWQRDVPLVEPILYDPDHWPWTAVGRGGNEEENAGTCRSASPATSYTGRGTGFRLALVARRK